jgi:flagellar biosynthesis/type III secretory pathway chaperone
MEFLAQYRSTEPEESSRSLFRHRQTIKKTIERLQHENKMNDRILQKYLWLINYHNSIADETSHRKYHISEDTL